MRPQRARYGGCVDLKLYWHMRHGMTTLFIPLHSYLVAEDGLASDGSRTCLPWPVGTLIMIAAATRSLLF